LGDLCHDEGAGTTQKQSSWQKNISNNPRH
jgi:hypothetical protein